MKRLTLLSLALVLAACSNASGPKGIDPTVFVQNQLTGQTDDTVYLKWFDQRTGLVSIMKAPPGTSCLRFTVPAVDSIYIEVSDTVQRGGTYYWARSPLFMVGQPFTIVNGTYVSDFFTATITNQVIPSMIADSLPPC